MSSMALSLMTMTLVSIVQTAEPQWVGGEVSRLSRRGDLETDIAAVDGAGWLGYQVRAVAAARRECSGIFDLERGGSYTSEGLEDAGGELFVFFRVVDGDVEAIRSVTSGCRVRAGAGPVFWLSPVSLEDSLGYLVELARRDPRAELAEDALDAIAWHAGVAADERLDALAGASWPLEIRQKAVFWMGAARGEHGFRSLRALSESVVARELRENVVFALHVSDADGATDTLIAIARDDADPEVREKALFWLGQEGGERAASAIVDAVRDDPDLEVKKKAVFALSQLPLAEGIPLLVDVAETHRDPEIRKKAFFWLGQTGDPRALAFFERVLSN